MQEFMTALIECSVTMSVLVLVFIAATPWLSKRYSAKWLYYIWLVLVIGLIIPFRFHPDTALIQMNDGPAYIQQMIPGNPGNIVDPTITTNKLTQEAVDNLMVSNRHFPMDSRFFGFYDISWAKAFSLS